MLTLFHDFSSPASAVAVARAAALRADGVPLAFEGFEAIGVDIAVPVDLQTVALIERLAPHAEEVGIQLRRPDTLPPTGLAHVLAHHAKDHGCEDPVRDGLYRALWRDGADLGDPTTLIDIAQAAGMPRETAGALLADRVALAACRREMAAHRRIGVGGVPVLLASQTLLPGLLDSASLRELALAV